MASIKEWEEDLKEQPFHNLMQIERAFKILSQWPLFYREYHKDINPLLNLVNAEKFRRSQIPT